MTEDEVYPNAPVVLVTMEIRHPPAGSLTSSENRALKRLLAERLPIERPGQNVHFEIAAPPAQPTTTIERFPRFLNRESNIATAIREQSTIVETSAYQGWQSFVELCWLVLEARVQVSPIAGIERVGLRYIDEIRAPESAADVSNWGDWVDASLLGPKADMSSEAGAELIELQGAAVYRCPRPGQSLVLRYGPRDGYAVDPDSDLRRVKAVGPGPFFLMDIDSFWVPDGPIPEFEKDYLHSIYDALHRPVRTLFEDLITSRYRDEVLRNG
jgi:uncharacterized protein (TIGR04255 family)